ncbi:hypothetical protein ARMSODRAFT_1027148 [Armillaria solidipes]|uniref:EF-hand domain-containing protein n=1 Tax=Armillaria solidipes TaxID=1076256 RepID=A0A2H3B531_9AGAR|nr:hypothetical protein ARMSODRAFT_1027148 [Armillaria solidipes]
MSTNYPESRPKKGPWSTPNAKFAPVPESISMSMPVGTEDTLSESLDSSPWMTVSQLRAMRVGRLRDPDNSDDLSAGELEEVLRDIDALERSAGTKGSDLKGSFELFAEAD